MQAYRLVASIAPKILPKSWKQQPQGASSGEYGEYSSDEYGGCGGSNGMLCFSQRLRDRMLEIPTLVEYYTNTVTSRLLDESRSLSRGDP